jgi:hypothetical protein
MIDENNQASVVERCANGRGGSAIQKEGLTHE